MQYFKTIFSLAQAQFKSIMRQWVYIFFMLGLPLLFMVVFGMIYGNANTSSFNVAIFNNTENETGKEISESILIGENSTLNSLHCNRQL